MFETYPKYGYSTQTRILVVKMKGVYAMVQNETGTVINRDEQENITDLSFLKEYNQAQCDAITELSLNTTGLETLEGIERLPNLQVIDLGGTVVKDLSPLKALAASLTSLRLTNVPIAQGQLQTISGLTGLQKLYIDSNDNDGQLSDISSLANLRRLSVLSVAGNPNIKSLAGFEQLTRLEDLDISATNIRELRELSSCEALTSLTLKDIEGFSATDLSPLNKLSALEKLYVDEALKRSADTVLAGIKNRNTAFSLAQ